MPRIDPMKLLVCLSVLLAPNGGIRTAAEVKRLANLMAKFSKKLVSKCIYIQILKCTETELLGQFMQTGGWSLVHMWLVDGIGSKNWPLIQELLELLLCCPVDVERLKINSTPRLVKSLSTDSAHESVRLLATKLVEQWLYIVKAPKQLSSSMIPQNPSEIQGSGSGVAAITDGTAAMGDQQGNSATGASHDDVRNGSGANNVTDIYQQNNGYMVASKRNGEEEDPEVEHGSDQHKREDDVDTAKKAFRTVVGHQDQTTPTKTSLVLKITTKNGKQVVTEFVAPSSRKNKSDQLNSDGDYGDDADDDEDEEEVLVNIESEKRSDDALMDSAEKRDTKESKKLDADHRGKEGSRERNMSSSSRDKDRHHRDRERDRKSGSSSGSRHSSKSSGGGNSSSSSSSKHKSSSSSKSGSSSSSSRDKDRHGSSSSNSSSSKHKSSSSSSSKSNGSSSRTGSSHSSSSDKHRDKLNHSSSSSSSNKERRDSKSHSISPSRSSHTSGGKYEKLSRKNSKDESIDSGSESSTAAHGTKSSSSTNILSKKASISIEVRNPENRPKTVKTYNSQFRSHGLIEEAPPPPSRKGLKKPSSSASSGAASASPSSTALSGTVGLTAIGTTKRSSPPPSSGKDGAPPSEKKLKEDPPERPGSIKLIPPKRQHALIESDMFMDALSATLRKDVKKRKRRTSGSENSPTSSKPGETGKPEGGTGTTSKPAPESLGTGETAATEAAATPTTPTSPKVVPTIAPMSFYRDTLAEEDASESKDDDKATGDDSEGADAAGGEEKRKDVDDGKEHDTAKGEKDDDEEEGALVKKPKRVRCELNEDDDGDEDGEEKKKVKKESEDGDEPEDTDKTELMEVVMNDVEKKIAAEAEGGESERKALAEGGNDDETAGKKPPGPGCGPDGPPGVLVIHRRKGPKKQLRWRVAEELEEVRFFELDVTERCNVTKSFTDMKQMERVDERQQFRLARKVGSEDNMDAKTEWRPLLLVDNVPSSPDGSQSVERNVQHQRTRSCLQAIYFNKQMIPDSPAEPEPADINQTADPVHIPLEDVTGNPDSVNDFTSMPWPDPKSTPPHESAAFNSPFFPTDLPPGAGFGPGGFPPPFPPGAAVAISGPAPWNVHPRPGALQPGMFPLNQPPPGMVGPPPSVVGGAGGGGGGSPNILSLPPNIPPNIPPPGLFPGPAHFNAPPPDLALLVGGDVAARRVPGAGDRGAADYRTGPPPPPQQWVTNSGRGFGGNNPRGGGGGGGGGGGVGFGNRGGGPGNWNRSAGSTGDRGRNGEEGRGNYRGHWMQNNNNRGHNNNNNNNSNSRGTGGRKW